jgi:fumarate reductase subunit C
MGFADGGASAMNRRAQVYLWAAQRISAAVLTLCVLAHLFTLIYAVRGGLSAAEILARTRGSIAWAAFYLTFVIAIAIHVPIGLRTVLAEWLNWRGVAATVFVLLVGIVLAGFGIRAVWGVVS